MDEVSIEQGNWVWSSAHRQSGQIVERVDLWGEVTLRIWLPQSDSVVRVRESEVEPVGVAPPVNESRLRFVLAASRIANLLAEDVLLAPVDSTVIPLPPPTPCSSQGGVTGSDPGPACRRGRSGEDNRGRPDHPGTQAPGAGQAGPRGGT